MSGDQFRDFNRDRCVDELSLEGAWRDMFEKDGQDGTRGFENNSLSLNVRELEEREDS